MTHPHRHLDAKPIDFWLARGAILIIVGLQLGLVNDLTVGPRWLAPSIELALLIPLSIATAWTQKTAQKASAESQWHLLGRERRMVRRLAIALTFVSTLMNFGALAQLIQAILSGHAGTGRIRVRSVRSDVQGDDVGYIRMTQFTEQTTEGLKKAISDISAKISNDKLKGYILDLRNNPGGLLDQAISVSSAFIQRGEIVSTRGRNPEETQRFTAHGGDLTKGKPLIVLINGGSASASEIVAGALQDQKRATILGTRSFGKGSVQTIIPLGSDNGALRLTTARYFTPSGRSIQAKGIVPDIEVLQDLPDDIKAKTDTSTKGEASLRGHLQGDAGKEQTGSQSYIPPDPKNDKALNMAEDLLRGIKVNPAFPPSVKNASSQKRTFFARPNCDKS